VLGEVRPVKPRGPAPDLVGLIEMPHRLPVFRQIVEHLADGEMEEYPVGIADAGVVEQRPHPVEPGAVRLGAPLRLGRGVVALTCSGHKSRARSKAAIASSKCPFTVRTSPRTELAPVMADGHRRLAELLEAEGDAEDAAISYRRAADHETTKGRRNKINAVRMPQLFRRVAQLARFAQWPEFQSIGPGTARRARGSCPGVRHAATLLELAPAAARAVIIAAGSFGRRRGGGAHLASSEDEDIFNAIRHTLML
jgi:hypothetical protein